eukprot:GHRR01006955.1.p2 GENE.GHRR01006955.1~~GHRR01006955.1.p2  ORF type:complete len:117 (-),score=29.51 GHRR01006955.1:499-849(-)
MCCKKGPLAAAWSAAGELYPAASTTVSACWLLLAGGPSLATYCLRQGNYMHAHAGKAQCATHLCNIRFVHFFALVAAEAAACAAGVAVGGPAAAAASFCTCKALPSVLYHEYHLLS